MDAALLSAAGIGNATMAQTILDLSKVSQDTLDAALFLASSGTTKELKAALEKAGAKPLPPASEQDRKEWAKLAGSYDSDGGQKMTVAVKETGLVINGRPVKPTGPDTFAPLGTAGTSYRVERKNGEVSRITTKRFTAEYSFYRFKEPVATPVAPAVAGGKRVAAPLNWPSFRGPDGTGVADGQNPPVTWDVAKGESVRWKTAIPGLGHSCPVVWGDRVFVTTAVSSGQPDPKIRVGNYGDVGSVDDTSKHTWQVLCLDRDSGKVLWTKTAFEGVPKIKRHLKGSQANCTPATDGRHVVACFGSEGLYCYDFAGKLLWKRDLSTLDSSFALDREYEWGFGNSPVLHDGRCILQCDLSRDSFIAAFSLDRRLEGVVHAAGRDPFLEFPGRLAERRADGDRDQRRPVRPRVRPGDRGGVVAAGQEVRGDRPDPGGSARTWPTSPAATGRSSRSSRCGPGRPATSR